MFQPIGLAASRVVERIAAAHNRGQESVRRAGIQARDAGGTAMDMAVAAVGAGFNQAAEINDRKLRVLRAIERGAGHPANHVRYGKRLALIRERIEQTNPDVALTIAINLTEGWLREERKSFGVAAALGYGNRLSLEVLLELRLILRLLRRSDYRNHLLGILGFALIEEPV